MQLLGVAIVLAMGGTLIAALYTFVIGLGGAPGALLTANAMHRSGSRLIPTWGVLLTMFGQLFVSLAFVALVVQSTRSWVGTSVGIWKWIVWLVAFWVATAPVFFALKDAATAKVKNVQHGAITLTAPLTALGFIVFALAPSIILWGWYWVPHF